MAFIEGKQIKRLTVTIETDAGTETIKISGKDVIDYSDDARLTEWHDGMQIGYVESARRMMRVEYVKPL